MRRRNLWTDGVPIGVDRDPICLTEFSFGSNGGCDLTRGPTLVLKHTISAFLRTNVSTGLPFAQLETDNDASQARVPHSGLSIFQNTGVAGPSSTPESDLRQAAFPVNCPSGM
jgi:hypothetical protein